MTEDEVADLTIAFGHGLVAVIAWAEETTDAYRAQGYVMGDLAHDGTLKAQAEAGEQ